MKKKVLLSSIVTIALCLCLIAGSTFALFTSTSQVNVAVTAGDVDMTASVAVTSVESVVGDAAGTIVDENGATYSYQYSDAKYFLNRGYAEVSGTILTVTNITPGDKVNFAISGKNDSNVAIQYRYVIECISGYKLMDGLKLSVDGGNELSSVLSYTSPYMDLAAGTDMTVVPISLALPVSAGNEYERQSLEIRILVEAVQGNAVVADNTDPVIVNIPKIGSAADLAAALASGASDIILGSDIALTDTLVVNSPVTINLNGNKLTSSAKKAIELHADATIKGGIIEGANRCIDTRTAVDLVLEDLVLIADEYTTAFGNPQPITIGGSDNGTTIAMKNVSVSAESGYCIIAFVESDVTAIDCNFSGYNALYVKPGAENSVFNFKNCDITGSTGNNDVEGNSFAAIAIQTDDVTVNVDANSSLTAIGNYCYAVGLGYTLDPIVEGNVVNVDCVVSGNALSATSACEALNTVNFAD